jgi:predicted MFS family arabinose efflux permease
MSMAVQTAHDSVRAGDPVGLATVFGLSMGAVVAISLARFAYALLLPPMRSDLGWSYAQAGALNTSNAAGYLVGAIATAAIARRLGVRRTFLIGMAATALLLLVSGMTADFAVLLVVRTLTGFTGAFAFVIGAVLAAQAGIGASRARQGLFIATYFGGGGTGIVLSGLAVPLVLELGGGWRGGWLVMGAMSCVCALFAAHAAARVDAIHAPTPPAGRAEPQPVSLVPVFVTYILFGAGYIGYMTFIIAYLRTEAASSLMVAGFWATLGVASVAASFAWGPLFARLRGGRGMATALVINAIGAALPLLGASIAACLLSAVLFGASLMAVPSAMTDFVRRILPERAWTRALGQLTVVFGLGQCLGPVLSGALSDSALGIHAGLLVSVALLLLAAMAALLQADAQRA